MSYDVGALPKVDSTMNGIKFVTYEIFKEGHECNAMEAKVLNNAAKSQVRADLIDDLQDQVGKSSDDNFDADKIDAAVVAEFQKQINELYAEFEFSESEGRGRKADPVTTRANGIIRAQLILKFQESGVAASEIDRKILNAKVKEVREQNPQIVEMARKQLEAEAGLFDVEV